MGSAGRTPPPPPTDEAQTAVAQQPVSDVGVQGNLALKRETGGTGGTGGGATNVGGTSPLAEQGAKGKVSPGTGTTGTVRTTGTGGGGDPRTSRDVRGPALVPAPPGRVGPGGKKITQLYPPEAWDDITQAESRYPKLGKARMRPVYRGSGRGKFEERMKTTATSYSFQAEMPDGSTIELDGITAKGMVVDNKELTSIAERWREWRAPKGDAGPPDVYEVMTGTGAAQPRPSRAQFRTKIRGEVTDYGDQLERQSKFIDAYGLRGGEWVVPDADWKTLLDAELIRRGITNIKIVVHE
jgi:hypothetical protein